MSDAAKILTLLEFSISEFLIPEFTLLIIVFTTAEPLTAAVPLPVIFIADIIGVYYEISIVSELHGSRPNNVS